MIKKDTVIIILLIMISFFTYLLYNQNQNTKFEENSLAVGENNKKLLQTNKFEEKNNETNNIVMDNISKENIKVDYNDNISIKNEVSSNDVGLVSLNKEKEIIEFFNNLENEVVIDTKENNFEKVKVKINSAFFTSVDFIFYDKPIRGVTFKQLSDKTKLQILKITDNIDSMIMKQFPNYKESIKENSSNTYIFLKENINKLEQKIINKTGAEKYNDFIDEANEFKNKIIDLKNKAIGGIKEWYENLKSKNEDSN